MYLFSVRGLSWFGLIWFGLVRLVWFVWVDLVCFVDLVWIGLVWHSFSPSLDQDELVHMLLPTAQASLG